MRSSWKNFVWVIAVAFCVGLAGGPVQAATLNIDYAEAPEFDKTKRIRIFFDLLNQENRVVKDLKEDEITSVLIDGEEVPGTKTIETFAEAKEWVGIAILIAAHRSYTEVEDAEESEGEESEANQNARSTFDRCKQGAAKLIQQLGGSDTVSVFQYDEKGQTQIVSWTSDFSNAANKVEKASPPEAIKEFTDPPLYKAIKQVLGKIKDKAEQTEGFPRRRILLVLTDGKDQTLSKPKKADKAAKGIIELATTTEVKIYGIGYSEGTNKPLVRLSGLVDATKGAYREVPVPDEGEPELASTIEEMGEEIKKQYVLTFEPDVEVFRGAEKPVKIRVETKKDGEDAGGEYDGVKVAVIPTDIWPIIMWVLIGLGSLLGIFLLIKMIKAIAAARANRPVEYVEEDTGPVGPYKGKLSVLEGTYVGAEFYLTDDVTTIGAMDGNNIVLEAPGVSKRHAGIKIEDMRFELADFGSTNGTHVNGNKITKQFLRDQDIISIGDCKMKFSLK